jgi:hypothetical protein
MHQGQLGYCANVSRNALIIVNAGVELCFVGLFVGPDLMVGAKPGSAMQ